jgi:hypothetical protein
MNNTESVSNYDLKTSSGRHIRKATKVQLGNRVIRFIDKMSRREALKQARALIKLNPNVGIGW